MRTRAVIQGLFLVALIAVSGAFAQDEHYHKTPERLGKVTFATSCKPEVQASFERGVALLHSFAYSTAETEFKHVIEQDSACAMAHWGVAMTYFHQLWDPPIAAQAIPLGQAELDRARHAAQSSERERGFISALELIYREGSTVPYRSRALAYEQAMSELAAKNKSDSEVQVWYALSLLANATPTDKNHTRQKKAAEILEPLNDKYPQHPGILHYLIHAYDNAELAPRGLKAARTYSQIAPSAPHALHMPSHIFTRLGRWEDSIASNTAAQRAAHAQGDTGEELHSMDYLVYAYLQSGRDTDAGRVLEQVRGMPGLNTGEFKIGYAATAMPVRYAVERSKWDDAARITPPEGAPPQVVAIAVWARGLGSARLRHPEETRKEMAKLGVLETQLRNSGNEYWATQVQIQSQELTAWANQAEGKKTEALKLMRDAADEEDAIEKLPVTPGPILPAREQLGELLLEQGHPDLASKEFESALRNSPGRRRSLDGASRAAQTLSQK